MPKLIAPHGASWRGRALGPGDTLDVSEAEALLLAAHGFRPAEEAVLSKNERDFTGTAPLRTQGSSASMSLCDAGATPAVQVESSIPGGAVAVRDIAKLSRKDLLKCLRGQSAGNLFVKSTDELRALAAKVLAGDAPKTEAQDGRE